MADAEWYNALKGRWQKVSRHGLHADEHSSIILALQSEPICFLVLLLGWLNALLAAFPAALGVDLRRHYLHCFHPKWA
jgi:membrane protein YqaA with SNARE-associated domain